MSRLIVLASVLFMASVAHAQSPAAQRARAIRRAEIARHNYAQAEALRLLFGPNGLPALTRPADPWNAYRGYGYRGYRAMPYTGYGYGGGYGHPAPGTAPSYTHRHGSRWYTGIPNY